MAALHLRILLLIHAHHRIVTCCNGCLGWTDFLPLCRGRMELRCVVEHSEAASQILKGHIRRLGHCRGTRARTAKPSARATRLRRQGAKGLESAPGGPAAKAGREGGPDGVATRDRGRPVPGVGKRVEIGGRSGAAEGNRALTGRRAAGYDAVMRRSNSLSPMVATKSEPSRPTARWSAKLHARTMKIRPKALSIATEVGAKCRCHLLHP